MLDGEAMTTWLEGNNDDAQAVLRPPPDGMLQAHRVTPRVNNPHYDGDDLLEASDGG